jgi:hypothetical protein
MGKKQPPRMSAAEGDIAELMADLALYLVEAGITTTQFANLSRLAFFTAASRDARFENKRINQSEVAAMTGLTRVQVRQFAKNQLVPRSHKRGLLARVLEGWVKDAQFIGADYRPRRLPLTGNGASFASLVRKHGGDVSPRSVLRELERQNYVTVENRLVHLNLRARQTSGQLRLQSISAALANLIKDREGRSNRKYPMRTLSCEITYPATSAKGRILMQQRLAEKLQAFVAELKSAGIAASVEAPPSQAQKNSITRTRIAILSEELDEH